MPATQRPNLGLFAGWDPGEDGWGPDMNQNLYRVDALVQPIIQDVVNTPPASPSLGQMWQVDGSPTGDFVGHNNKLALWSGTAWVFVVPKNGWVVFRASNSRFRKFDGTAWHREDSVTATANTLMRRDSEGKAFVTPGTDPDHVATVGQISAASVAPFSIKSPTAAEAHTVTAADLGAVIVFNSANPCTVTVPDDALENLAVGFWTQFRNMGTGVITVAPSGTDVLEGAGAATVNPNKLNSVYKEASGRWVTAGDMQ